MATIVVDASRAAADLASVDALAALQLAATRAGDAIEVRGASEDLRRLIALSGLERVLRVEP